MLEKVQNGFETTVNNKPVRLYLLQNKNGVEVSICNFGARIIHFIVPKDDRAIDIVLGFNSIEDYINPSAELYYGATIGPFANRIANAEFALNNKTYSLEANAGSNSLHGGSEAFHNQVWEVQKVGESNIILSFTSPDGESGFPGTVTTEVSFTLSDENELIINYKATSDQDTVINLTNHSYFNLNGEGSGSILNHDLNINADYYVPINAQAIPLRDFALVEDSPFDFRDSKKIGQDINEINEQLSNGNGYDHSFAINQTDIVNFAASATGDQSGLTLEVYTTEPGMQFYTANYLNGEIGKSGKPYTARTAFCLETQHHPDSPNQKNFPSTVLHAGKTFKSTTIYKIS